MAQTWTIVSLLALATLAVVGWRLYFRPDNVSVRLRLDRSAPGAHLMWDIMNVGTDPITVTKLIVHSSSGRSDETVALGVPQKLYSREGALIPTDVDWALLTARSIAVADADGTEHPVSKQQLARIQEQVRSLIDRREYAPSPGDWLSGATNL